MQRSLASIQHWAQAAETIIVRLQAIVAERAELATWQRVLVALDGSTLDFTQLGEVGPVLRKCLLVIAALLVALLVGLQPPLAAFFAACALFVTRRIKSEKILGLVDWSLLVMFCGLFAVTGALEITGVSQDLFNLVSGLARSGVAPLTLVTTLLSNTISNVPAVLLFRPLVARFPNPMQAWLTLAAASTLAGNLTLIGSVANLIVAEQALKVGVRVTFMEYLRAGVIITVLTLMVAVVWLEIVT